MQSYASGGLANPKIGPYINTISNPTSDFSTLGTLLGTIDLANPDPDYGWGNSAVTDSLNYFANDIFNNVTLGNGFSSQSPLNYVFIITDGVQDVYGASCFWKHCTQALDPSLCDQFKAVATVGVIYTTYLPFYQNNNSADGYDTLYDGIVQPDCLADRAESAVLRDVLAILLRGDGRSRSVRGDGGAVCVQLTKLEVDAVGLGGAPCKL